MLRDLHAAIDRADAVSFDVFDTLFVRPLCDPEDLFDLVGARFGLKDFRRIRQEAQAEAFREMHRAGRNEITLDGIYACFPDLPVPAEVLKQAELEMELALTRPNPELAELFATLVASGRKPVVLTSDMYLPASFFTALLERHRLPAVPAYISAERDATKRDRGELFEIVARGLGLAPGRILHVGDNAFSDIQQGRAKGFDTWHYRARRQPAQPKRPSLSASMAAGLVRTHGEPTSAQGFYDLGFRRGGPAAAALLGWVGRQAAADRVDMLLFISRDGYVLERMARAGKVQGLPPYHYFKGSRVAFTLAATDEGNYAAQVPALLAGADGLAPLEVLERIGVTPPDDGVMEALGLGTAQVLRPGSMDRMAAFLMAYRAEVLKVCRRTRSCLFQYLLELGVQPGMRLGLVDVGWNGTTQDTLAHVLPKLMPAELVGYYLCLAETPECLERRRRLEMRALLSAGSLPAGVLDKVYANRVVAEILFSAPHGSVIGYERLPGGGVRALEDQGRCRGHEWRKVSDEIVRGVEDFWEGFQETCAAARFTPDPLDLCAPLLDLLTGMDDQMAGLLATVKNFDTWAQSRHRDRSLREYLTV